VEAAEKGVQTTTPLRWHFWTTEVETTLNEPFNFSPCWLGRAGGSVRGDYYSRDAGLSRIRPQKGAGRVRTAV